MRRSCFAVSRFGERCPGSWEWGASRRRRFSLYHGDPRPPSCRCSGSDPRPESAIQEHTNTETTERQTEMRKHAIAALLAAIGLTLASCASSAGGEQGGGDPQGNDHGGSGGDRSQQAARETDHGEAPRQKEMRGGGMAGMDQGGMSSKDMAATSREMVMPNGEYSDKAFIDAMVPHHERAVEMAEVALDEADRPQIRDVAEDIVSSQRSEIRMFGEIRERKYGSAEPTTEMNEEDMRAMSMSDPRELAKARPFDKAFIDEMIPHHQSAIAMAEVARKETKDPEIRKIAEDIVSAQEREIEQMEGWREQWYPTG